MTTTSSVVVTYPPCGQHLTLDALGVDRSLLDDVVFCERVLRRAVEASGATVLYVLSYRFQPCGVTVLALLSESHASLHTYPDDGVFMADIFTCGTVCDPARALSVLRDDFAATRMNVQTHERGFRA